MKKVKLPFISAIAIMTIMLGIIPALSCDSAGGTLAGKEGDTNVQMSPVKSTGLKVMVGKPLVFSLAASDPDNDSLIYSASNLPPGATFDPLTGTFSWTPAAGQAGTYNRVHFEASDGQMTASEDITITVSTGVNTGKYSTAAFTVNLLSISPATSEAGRKIFMRVNVTNESQVSGTCDVVLQINGQVEQTLQVSLSAGASTKVSFNVVKYDAGEYMVDVNGLSGSFTIVADRMDKPGTHRK